MSQVYLSGHLICRNDEEAEIVRQHLPLHIALTRDEAGCVSFEVKQSQDPLTWSVEEEFRDETAFDAHQKRVAASEWGRATAGIERRYTIRGLSGS